jgi:hypothetical protein
MGRVVDSWEHNIDGEVSIGRPVIKTLILTPDIESMKLQRLEAIEALKQFAKDLVVEQVQIGNPED